MGALTAPSALVKKWDSRATRGWSDLAPVEMGWLDRHPSTLFMVVVTLASSLALGAAVAVKPKIAIVVVLAVAAGLAVLRRPAIGGYLLVGLVPITSGLRQGFPIPGLRLSELLIGTLAVAILIPATFRQALRWRTFDWMLLAYATYSFLIGAYDLHHHGIPFTWSLVGTLFGPMQFFLLYRSVAVSLPLHHQRNRALALLILASIPVSFIALLQQLKISGINTFVANITGSTVFNGYGYFFARATGPFSLWTPLAGYLLVILLLSMSLLLHGVDTVLSRRVIFFVLALDALGLLLSAELSAMIALVPAGIILGVWSGKLKFLLRWGLLVILLLGISFGSYLQQRLSTEFFTSAGSGRSVFVPQTLQFRFNIWTQQYFPAIREQIFNGYGPTFPSSIVWQYTESQYVTFLMWGGIPLLVIFIAMMWALFARARALARPEGTDSSRWAMARAVALLVVATYFIDSVYPYITSGGLPQALFALVGIMVATEHRAPRTPQAVAPPRIQPVRQEVLV
jgi:hypothetical protein